MSVTSRAIVGVLFALSALWAAGCLVGPVDDIPCTVDEECATDSFCDLGNGVCIALSESASPPDLQIVGVETPDGKVGLTVVVEREVPTRLQLHVKNRGLSPAEGIELELSEYHAVEVAVHNDTIPDAIEGEETAKVTMDVLIAADSSTPVPFDWFLSYSGRVTRGIFNLAPPRPVGPPD